MLWTSPIMDRKATSQNLWTGNLFVMKFWKKASTKIIFPLSFYNWRGCIRTDSILFSSVAYAKMYGLVWPFLSVKSWKKQRPRSSSSIMANHRQSITKTLLALCFWKGPKQCFKKTFNKSELLFQPQNESGVRSTKIFWLAFKWANQKPFFCSRGVLMEAFYFQMTTTRKPMIK